MVAFAPARVVLLAAGLVRLASAGVLRGARHAPAVVRAAGTL
jgi:hypothetical protein